MSFPGDFSLTIDRVDKLSVDDFINIYSKQNKPVLVTGVVSEWKAFSKWNIKYLKSVVGHKSIPIKRMHNGNYVDARTETMRFSDYLDIVINKPIKDERYYLSEQPVNNIFQEITKDFNVPEYIQSDEYKTVCYMGSNVYSQIHFHPYGNALLCVVSGTKRVKLFAPDQTPYLYQKFNFSKINSEPVDLKKFPLYKKARYLELEVKAGEMLFFPIYWWHGVETEAFSSALVFFWDDPRKERWSTPKGIPWYCPILFEPVALFNKSKKFLKSFK